MNTTTHSTQPRVWNITKPDVLDPPNYDGAT